MHVKKYYVSRGEHVIIDKCEHWISQLNHWEKHMYPSRYTRFHSLLIGKYSVFLKPFFEISKLMLIKDHFPGCDGFIFTKLLNRYQTFRNSMDACIKWKQPIDMTIDFAIELCYSSSAQTHHIAGVNSKFTRDTHGKYFLSSLSKTGISLRVAFADMNLSIPLTKQTIGEFAWDSNQWNLIRIRYDKKLPNTIETVVATIHDLESNITLDEINH